jgi:hypothetical protein
MFCKCRKRFMKICMFCRKVNQIQKKREKQFGSKDNFKDYCIHLLQRWKGLSFPMLEKSQVLKRWLKRGNYTILLSSLPFLEFLSQNYDCHQVLPTKPGRKEGSDCCRCYCVHCHPCCWTQLEGEEETIWCRS